MINWPENIKLNENKYSKWYLSLIEKARLRGTVMGYSEKHHIIPRSLGGNDSKDNLVSLTAREHYIAHALLWRMKLPGVAGSKMAYAFNTFISKMNTKERGIHHTYTITSRVYEVFRKEYSRLLKEKYAREGGTWVGRKHSEESKRKIGEKSKLKVFKRGPENPNWGKKRNLSVEEKAKRSDSIKKIWADPAFKAMMSEKRGAYLQTPEGKSQMAAQANARRGVKRDPAIMEKCAASKRGKKEHEIYSPDAIAIRKEAYKNRVISDEAKERMRLGRLKGISKPKKKKPCPHCGKMCAGNMLAKWHGDNCKTLLTSGP